MDLAAAVRQQADGCARLGSPMYAGLCERLAEDVEAGGPAAAVLADHRDAPGPDAVALRLLGSVHRLVLQRRAGALAAYYPSVGGTWEPEAGWAAFRDLLAAQPGAVAEWLDRPPQTNEVGRAAALMAGLRTLGGPVRLFEIGSSAGLLLLADHYRYVAEDGAAWGPADSPVVLDPAWTGPVPAGDPRIVERVGSDVMPVDPRSTEGRLTLTAYVWADQAHRHERLRGALELAARVPYEVRRQGAVELVASMAPSEGATTVLWHSVMWQYLPPEDRRTVSTRVEELGASATASAPFAHLSLEPQRPEPGVPHDFLVVLRTWPGGERRLLGTAAGHGLPMRWREQPLRP